MTAMWLLLFTAGMVLLIVELVGRPRRWVCYCKYDATGRHLRRPGLLLLAIYFLAGGGLRLALDTSPGWFFPPLLLGFGAWTLWRWWKHPKNVWVKEGERV